MFLALEPSVELLFDLSIGDVDSSLSEGVFDQIDGALAKRRSRFLRRWAAIRPTVRKGAVDTYGPDARDIVL